MLLILAFLCSPAGVPAAGDMEAGYKALKKVQLMCETGTNISAYQDAVVAARLAVEGIKTGPPETVEKLKDALNDYVYASRAWVNALSRYDREVSNFGFGGHEEQYVYFSQHPAAKRATVPGPGKILKINMEAFTRVAWQMAAEKLDSIDPTTLTQPTKKKATRPS